MLCIEPDAVSRQLLVIWKKLAQHAPSYGFTAVAISAAGVERLPGDENCCCFLSRNVFWAMAEPFVHSLPLLRRRSADALPAASTRSLVRCSLLSTTSDSADRTNVGNKSRVVAGGSCLQLLGSIKSRWRWCCTTSNSSSRTDDGRAGSWWLNNGST